MGHILIKNIQQLVAAKQGTGLKVAGAEMANLPTISNAWIRIEEDKIADLGSMESWPGIEDWSDLEVIDADGKMVLPCWCDSHTHLVFAASREDEFVDRIKGLSYEEIAQRGGGILNSTKRMQESSEEDLFQSALGRLNEIARTGTGAVEIKSGYGLTVEAELKMLRIIKKLKEESPLTIKATFLGAHALPAEYQNNREGYLNLIIHEMLPTIKEEGLADFMDVFCETNYFTPEETDQLLQAGDDAGLRPKVHVNQFTSIGGMEVCVKHNALSVDHLEVMEDKDIEVLKGSAIIPTVLPSCSFFLNIPYAPARRLIDGGLAVALATDYNPGSSPSGNMPFVVSLACIKMGLLPEEAISAATINGAAAMDLSTTHGSIEPGKPANIFITKAMPSLAHLPYAFGSNPIDTVILNGKIQIN